MRVYVDTCLVIYLIEGAPQFQSAAIAAITSASATDVFCVSDLVRMECLILPIRTNDAVRQSTFERQLALFTSLPMTAAVFDLAAELRARHNLKTPDALHAACAMQHGCDELWTNDQRFAALAPRLRVRIVS